MKSFPIKNPKPNFDELKDILDGKKKPLKVHFVELFIDEEIKKYIIENYFGKKNISPIIFSDDVYRRLSEIETLEQRKHYTSYYKQLLDFWYRMGYSFMVDSKFLFEFVALTDQVLEYTGDTAIYKRGTRAWAQEGAGLIKTWEDFEKFEWNKYKTLISEYENHLDFLKANLPDGMKIAIHGGGLFELSIERLFGYANFFYLIYDNPGLVKSVVDMLGKISYELYSNYGSREEVGVIFLADDLGFKTSSMISVEKLNELFFPWYKKFADIAHKNKKHIWMHSCGYKYNVMDYLIEDVKLDAIHGFEDSNSPVIEMKQKYGKKIALLGGIDLDKLARMDKDELRHYIRDVLKVCMDGGMFALGSGNSFCNYIPVDNYFILLEEGFKWGKQ